MTLAEAMTIYGLQRIPALVLVRLNDANGVIVETQTLRDAVEERVGWRTTEDGIKSAVSRARRAIKGRGQIMAAPGVGFRIVWHKPDDATAGKL